ncbi:hypothetical protein [Kineosporia succinea]|uniref:Uncharacterized protein n=1 Tax=Kineosporia succinea TaxID=84632 RepID=A0ABT9PAW8_9ACTN|nr:hypothetical protein [Kineosporia succinea]MDP9829335.1 hypothetical protein [Kineosporia succinea]
MSDILGTIGFLGSTFFTVGGLGLLMWTETDGYAERIRIRKARNQIALDKARREADLDLKLREWQQTASLEDLTRHRERMEQGIDEQYGFKPEGERA